MIGMAWLGVASEIERSTGLFFLPSVGHHMTFCLICYVLVLYSAAAHEKWWSLLPGRWASIGTFSLWWVIICCFGSKPMGINSLAAVSPHKKKETCTNRICCCLMRAGVTGYTATEGKCSWQTSEHKEIKDPPPLKCLRKIDSATQSVTQTTPELTSLENKLKSICTRNKEKY